MNRGILFIEMYKLFKRRRAWIGPVLVFLLIIISFPLTLDINSDNPPQIYLSFIWISTLLVTMLGTELIFSEDFEDAGGLFFVERHVAADEHKIRAASTRLDRRHGRAHAKLSRLVACCRHNTA